MRIERKEYKAVIQALALVNEILKAIFEEEFRKLKKKWQIINELNISERTYERRKRELIYAVHKKIKNWRKLIKNMWYNISIEK